MKSAIFLHEFAINFPVGCYTFVEDVLWITMICLCGSLSLNSVVCDKERKERRKKERKKTEEKTSFSKVVFLFERATNWKTSVRHIEQRHTTTHNIVHWLTHSLLPLRHFGRSSSSVSGEESEYYFVCHRSSSSSSSSNNNSSKLPRILPRKPNPTKRRYLKFNCLNFIIVSFWQIQSHSNSMMKMMIKMRAVLAVHLPAYVRYRGINNASQISLAASISFSKERRLLSSSLCLLAYIWLIKKDGMLFSGKQR